MKPPEECYRFHETKTRISNQLDGHRCLTDQNFQSKKFAPFFQFLLTTSNRFTTFKKFNEILHE